MHEHDCDTDEDCEVYFLKPVNEYNIVDKIKEANKELFDEGENTDTPLEADSEQRRKVKFRQNLEDYEPETAEEDGGDGDPTEDEGCYEVLTLDDDDVEEECVLPSDRRISAIEECAEMLALEVQKKIDEIEIKASESDEEIEEICEEIVVMDMDTGRKLEQDTKEMNAVKEKSPIHENKREATLEKLNTNDDDETAEEDDDDKLSIIVASYLPPEPPQCEDKINRTKNQSFTRHFSFRRKGSAKRMNCRSPEITNLRLNYKTCCEFRNSECGKLPKYTGYMSEYGLTRDQLDKREDSLQKKHKATVEKNLKATEAEVRKMQDNERAFTTWLKNKMRFPINRTKNMFDVKKTNNNNGNSNRSVFRPKFCSTSSKNS